MKSLEANIKIYNLISVESRKLFYSVLPESYMGEAENNNSLILGAISDDEAVGSLVLELYVDGAHIKWLYVEPRFRRQKVATALINSMIDAIANSTVLLPVHVFFEERDAEGALLSFFENNSLFEIRPTGIDYRISVKERQKSAFVKSVEKKKDRGSVPFFELPKAKQNELCNRLRQKNLYEMSKLNMPQAGDKFIKHLCLAQLHGGEIKAFILTSDLGNKHIEVGFMYSENAVSMAALLYDYVRAVNESAKDCVLHIQSMEFDVIRLVDYMFPDTIDNEVMYDAYWNYTGKEK